MLLRHGRVRGGVRLAGRHVVFCACFLCSGQLVCSLRTSLPPGGDASQCSIPPAGSTPPPGQDAQRAQCHRGRGRGSQHRRSQPHRRRPRVDQRRDLVVADAALGADDEQQRIRLRHRQVCQRLTAADSCRTSAIAPLSTHPLRQLRRRHHTADRRNVGPPGLSRGRPGDRAPAAQSLVDLRRRSHRATQRYACQAMNASAPASVASSTASSERSDLGSACTTVTLGDAGGTASRLSTRAVNRPLPTSSTTQCARAPAPSLRSSFSPGRTRRTLAA